MHCTQNNRTAPEPLWQPSSPLLLFSPLSILSLIVKYRAIHTLMAQEEQEQEDRVAKLIHSGARAGSDSAWGGW